MSKSPIYPPVLDTKLVEAAQWRMRLAEHETSHVDVDAWRAADLANEHAWQQVQASWLLLGEHAAEPELLVLREQALGHAREARESRALSFGVRPWHRSLKALAAMLVLLLAGGSSYYVIFKHADTYATRAGERRTITLSDGSQLVLDSRTEVRVRYSRSERDVQLVGGQARFNVSKDASRPFVVHAGGQWVRAVGTAFNVDLLGDTLAVTLIEGRVRVRRAEAKPTQAIDMLPGQQLLLTEHAAPVLQLTDVKQTTAWENGRLVFEGEKLGVVVARFNRYSERQIELVGEGVAEQRISGVFLVHDLDGFVATVTAYLPLAATITSRGSIEIRPRTAT